MAFSFEMGTARLHFCYPVRLQLVDVLEYAQQLSQPFQKKILERKRRELEQAVLAEKHGADYLGVGAVFPSPTKPDAIGITQEKLQEICAGVKIPCVAIGGISLENADLLRGSGISGIAVVSALFSAGNVTQTARMLRKKAEEITSHK